MEQEAELPIYDLPYAQAGLISWLSMDKLENLLLMLDGLQLACGSLQQQSVWR